MAELTSLEPLAACDGPASMDSWELFNDFVGHQAQSLLGVSKAAYQLRLACEELFSNIIRHANGIQGGSTCTHLWVRAWRTNTPEPALVIELEDNGQQFDPQFGQAREIDPDQAIEQRSIGGLGLFLVQRSVDRVEYAWVDGHNRYRLFALLPTA